MGIIDDLKSKIQGLEQLKSNLELNKDHFEVRMMLFKIEQELKGYEQRLEELTTKVGPKICNHCKRKKTEEEVVESEYYVLCHDCQSFLHGMMTAMEAEERWGLSKGTIKQDIWQGKLEEEKRIGLIRKSGKYWLIHEKVMKNRYKEV